jgi:toxin HigB-1
LHALSICVIDGRVIRSFADKLTADVFYGEATARARRVPADVMKAVIRKFAQLDAAVRLEDLRTPPGNHLEQLRGDRAGSHSISVNDQWRIVFRWKADGAHDVELTDYH